MSAYLSVAIMPDPGETAVHVGADHINTSGQALNITCLTMGSARLQFKTPADALAWLDECRSLITECLVS